MCIRAAPVAPVPCSLRCARACHAGCCPPSARKGSRRCGRVQPHRRRPTCGGPRAGGSGLAAAGASFRLRSTSRPPWSARWGPGLRPSGCRAASTAPSGGSAACSLRFAPVGPRLRRPALALRSPAAGSAGPGARQCPLRSPRRAGANGESARGHGAIPPCGLTAAAGRNAQPARRRAATTSTILFC